jgi:DNA-binding NarL/FixJ family response regulator
MSKATAQVKHILMIDDDDMIRILFRDTFLIHSSHDSVEVQTVRTIAEAREYLGECQTPPDVIFMGLWLLQKHHDGSSTRESQPSLDFIRTLRQKPEYPNIPIVVYSRFAEAEFKEKAKDAGANYYLVKGEHTPKEIVEFVENL